ncbi:MAG: [FeFe] hydrogenase, group A [Spirochaetaceae bacterium]
MKVRTNTARLRSARRGLLELVLAAYPVDCLQCIKHGKCELQDLAERLEVRTLPYDTYTRGLSVDRTSRAIVRDMNKCIGCGRCVNCGHGVVYCPVGALYEREDIHGVWNAIDDPARTVAAQIAPAVRMSLGEEFGMEPGTLSIGTIYAALRAVGVDVVFDTNFSADLTIMEEGTELLNRVTEGGPLPLITSCSPGWINFGETYFPELLENVSTCKLPQQMMGAIIKTYFAGTCGLDPAAITSVSIMPCTAKKFEANRPEMNSSGFRDVDYVLTTRELARMIREAGIEFERLKEEKADPVLSQYTGAATIFGATGGVMEAAVRTAYEIQTGKAFPHIELEAVRGMDGVRQAAVDLAGTEVRVAVAHGLANARRLLEVVRNAKTAGELPFHFVEVMACTGGRTGGGGQPLENTIARRRQRIAGLYREDQDLPVRKSHELLHTGYTERPPHVVTDLSKAARRTMPKATPAG